MALRDKLQQAVAPHLEPGETVQAIFGAQTKSQYFALISYWIILFSKAWRVVVATDRRIIVFQSGRGGLTKIEGVTAQTRRDTLIGPPKGLWYRVDRLGERLYVHKRFHKDIDTADAWVTAAHESPQPR
ncbi:MAG TPA: hypothetical protein VHI95_16250 [Acidimicrobiales bacterium]|nr:hypothetical protein [Acidimicrobiales bacterium]